MLTTIEGVYHAGKIELREVPQDIHEDMFVRVTFISSKRAGTSIDLPLVEVDKALRHTLGI